MERSTFSLLIRFVAGAGLAVVGAGPALPAPSSVIVGTYFGNQSAVDAPAVSTALDGTKQVSFVFFQQSNDLLTSVWVHGTPVGSCPPYGAFLANDNGSGLPVTTSYLGGGSGAMSNGWTEIAFSAPITVSAGAVYHVVLTSQGAADSNNYFAVDQYTTPFTQWVPFNQFHDASFNTTYDNNGGFGILNAQPVFLVAGTEDYGNPYETVNNAQVQGSVAAGEVFQGPTGDPWAYTVGTYVKRVSSPSGPLLYELDDLTSPATVSAGTLASNFTASTSFRWIDVPLAGGPVQLFSSHQYRLWFSSPGSAGGAYYNVDNPTNPEPGSPMDGLTFDGTNSYAVLSTYGGAAWTNQVSSDLAFRFQAGTSPTPTATPTATGTPTSTPTVTPTSTITWTPTLTASQTPTGTPTITSTPTRTPTNNFTPTPTPDAALYLDQNFFDPRRQSLGMDLRVDVPGNVRVAVYNLRGEQVVKLSDGYRGAGNYRLAWDGLNSKKELVGNAVYFIVADQASGKRVLKVIVLK